MGYHHVDTPLSPAGRERAALLSQHLAAAAGGGSCGIVCSPLTRALQTAVLGFGDRWALQPHFELQPVAAAPSPGQLAGRPALPFYVTPLARERLTTLGDVGREWSGATTSNTDAELLPLLPALTRLQPQWWERHMEAPAAPRPAAASSSAAPPSSSSSSSSSSGTVLSSRAQAAALHGIPYESREALTRRVGALRAFLRGVPHRTIIVVAHCITLRELSGTMRKLKFCEHMEVTLR